MKNVSKHGNVRKIKLRPGRVGNWWREVGRDQGLVGPPEGGRWRQGASRRGVRWGAFQVVDPAASIGW